MAFGHWTGTINATILNKQKWLTLNIQYLIGSGVHIDAKENSALIHPWEDSIGLSCGLWGRINLHPLADDHQHYFAGAAPNAVRARTNRTRLNSDSCVRRWSVIGFQDRPRQSNVRISLSRMDWIAHSAERNSVADSLCPKFHYRRNRNPSRIAYRFSMVGWL